MIKTLRSIGSLQQLDGKKVLLRTDFNVHLSGRKIMDTERIIRTFRTIDYLLDHNAKVIIISHLGRPKSKTETKYSLKQIVPFLKERYKKVSFVPDCQGAVVATKVKNMKPGDIVVLENLRFYEYEKNNDELFAKALAKLADVYVNDAFGVSHRKHASVHAITSFIPSYAGFNLIDEIQNIDHVIKNFATPATAIIGGSKISTKIKVIERFCKKFDHVLIGGALAHNFFVNKKIDIGLSFYEKNYLKISQALLNKYETKIVLPIDVVISTSLKKSTDYKVVDLDDMDSTSPHHYIVDIGPKTIALFSKIIKQSQTVVWNGPLGLFEIPEFAKGTTTLAKRLASHVAQHPFGLIGGGETVSAINALGLQDSIDFISTGGGAMLEYIEKGTLPGIERLIK